MEISNIQDGDYNVSLGPQVRKCGAEHPADLKWICNMSKKWIFVVLSQKKKKKVW